MYDNYVPRPSRRRSGTRNTDEDESPERTITPKKNGGKGRGRPKGSAKKLAPVDAADEDNISAKKNYTPVKGRGKGRGRPKAVKDDVDEEVEGGEEDVIKPRTTSRRAAAKQVSYNEDDVGSDRDIHDNEQKQAEKESLKENIGADESADELDMSEADDDEPETKEESETEGKSKEKHDDQEEAEEHEKPDIPNEALKEEEVASSKEETNTNKSKSQDIQKNDEEDSAESEDEEEDCANISSDIQDSNKDSSVPKNKDNDKQNTVNSVRENPETPTENGDNTIVEEMSPTKDTLAAHEGEADGAVNSKNVSTKSENNYCETDAEKPTPKVNGDKSHEIKRRKRCTYGKECYR